MEKANDPIGWYTTMRDRRIKNKYMAVKNLKLDKQINYYVFDKIGFNMFDGIYIRINTGNDISPIQNYKVLCYVIFMMSGLVLKYHYWFHDNMTAKAMINPTRCPGVKRP